MAAATNASAANIGVATAAEQAVLLQTLAAAKQGLYSTAPNPRVGCLVYKEGECVARGWHARAGSAHAEVAALQQLGGNAQGCVVYISLEPCAHHGQTPPCVDALLAAKPKRVVIAMRDPNPQVQDGDGIARLLQAGIEVAIAPADSEVAKQASELNIGFVSRMTRARPWVRLKIAASIDGKTALTSGLSQWITSEEARADAHHLRARSCAILTGVGTALQDNPRLTVRGMETNRQPLRVLVDSQRRLPPDSHLFADTHFVVASASNNDKSSESNSGGGHVALPTSKQGEQKVDLSRLVEYLACERQVNELLVEAGRKLNGALLQLGLVDELVVYLSPHIIGESGKDMFAVQATSELLQNAPAFRICDSHLFDSGDIRLTLRARAE